MKNRSIAAALTLLALMAFGAGCNDDDNPTSPPAAQSARVRVLHASPDAPNVDVLVDGTVVLNDVPFKTFSSYLSVPAGARNFKVRATADPSVVVIDVTPTLAANKDYTVIARNPLSTIEPWLLTDNNTAPASGKIKVRLVHAAPGAPTVDIYITAPGADLATATPTLAGVPYGVASDYLEVPAGTYQVRVTPENTKTVAIDSGALTLNAGQIRTAVAVDAVGGGAPFGAVVLPDRN
ncbi:MAG TPA: DUF4397 domain-containing protein [Candidatus Krumholzibacteria bacterium]|nr:DUF4397 domain-containing protein [Candidatus Krumholzibacteria bacterium]